MKISAVMAIHNEQPYLRYSLPSLKKIESQIDEMIFVLNRCTDNSQHLIEQVFPKACILHKTSYRWVNECAETFQHGFNEANGDVVLALAADLIVDPAIPNIIQRYFRNVKVGTVCFRYLNYDLYSFWRRLHGYYDNLLWSVRHVYPKARHSGFYAFRRELMSEIGGLKDVSSEYDEFTNRIRESGWLTYFINETCNLHLRPSLIKSKQYRQGQARFYLPDYSLFETLLHSFIHLKPYVTVGYLHEKYGGEHDVGNH